MVDNFLSWAIMLAQEVIIAIMRFLDGDDDDNDDFIDPDLCPT